MKNLIFVITLVLISNAYAQNGLENTNVFLRVYDLEGKKISKGKVLSILDTSLQLVRNGQPMEIPVRSIGSVKTKHSGGNNVLIGAVVGAGTMAVVGVATADPDAWILAYNAGEGAAAGALLGGTFGAMVGGITILFKNTNSYEINGDTAKWKAFTEMIVNN